MNGKLGSTLRETNLPYSNILIPILRWAPCHRTVWAGVLAILVLGAASVNAFTPDEVYPRMGDPIQEGLTSSVNFAIERRPAAKNSKTTPPKAPVKDTSSMIRILIDPGHGGKDLGAPGMMGTLEKKITLRLGKQVKRELERARSMTGLPIEVSLTRDEDDFVKLKDRVRFANEWQADYFVSIHANSSPISRAHGFEVYFLNAEGTDEETRRLALKENTENSATPIRADVMNILSDVQTSFHIEESAQFAETMFSAISRRVLSSGRGVRQGPFTVLTGTAMPAVLVEVGYVTNVEDALNLTKDSYLKRLANAISTGIIEFAMKQKRLS